MTAFYTPQEDRWLKEKATTSGFASTLELCADGIYRTPEERLEWEMVNSPAIRIIAQMP